MPQVDINNDFSFNSNKGITIVTSKQALSAYAEKFPIAFQLGEEFKHLFLDTNVLLDYYGMSKSQKAKLLQFFRLNRERIYLPYVVQQEFMNNRLGVIKKDLFTPLALIHSDFITVSNKIKNDYKSYIDSKRNILSNDFPNLWTELNECGAKLGELMSNQELDKKIQEAVSESKEAYKNIEVVDELLDVCSQFHLLEPLDESEVLFLEQQYNELAEKLEKAKDPEKWKYTFPGSGDFGKKASPYGDYIIFHEVIKFMKNNNVNAIFLTNEKSKQDWMQRGKLPIVHYIEKVYLLTSRTMFIIHAEEPLNVSFENIHKSAGKSSGLEKFAGIHPGYTYYVADDEPLEVKANVLREFLLRYKDEAEFSHSKGEGAFPSIVTTALIDGTEHSYENGPKLYIAPSTSFFEHTEEGRALNAVYNDTLELWCRLDKVKRVGNDYVVFWRRSLECKKMLLEEFLDEMRGYEIFTETREESPNQVFQVSATLGSFTISLNIALNPTYPNEANDLAQVIDSRGKHK